jgi:hypothetical protein
MDGDGAYTSCSPWMCHLGGLIMFDQLRVGSQGGEVTFFILELG